nr:immunoglobulin heavy chain junction region [Mus musculus]
TVQEGITTVLST